MMVNLNYFIGHVIFWSLTCSEHALIMYKYFRCASEFARTELGMKRQVHAMFLGSSCFLGAIEGGGKLLILRQCYMCIWEAQNNF